MQAKDYTLLPGLETSVASWYTINSDSTSGGDWYTLLQDDVISSAPLLYAVALNAKIFMLTLSSDAARLVYDTALGHGGKHTQRIQI